MTTKVKSQVALDAAKEIVVARMGSANISVSKEGGKDVAEFFEAIYRKIEELCFEDGANSSSSFNSSLPL